MTEQPKCELCGQPMPPGEEMFKFHGYSGPCPTTPEQRRLLEAADIEDRAGSVSVGGLAVDLGLYKQPQPSDAARRAAIDQVVYAIAELHGDEYRLEFFMEREEVWPNEQDAREALDARRRSEPSFRGVVVPLRLTNAELRAGDTVTLPKAMVDEMIRSVEKVQDWEGTRIGEALAALRKAMEERQ